MRIIEGAHGWMSPKAKILGRGLERLWTIVDSQRSAEMKQNNLCFSFVSTPRTAEEKLKQFRCRRLSAIYLNTVIKSFIPSSRSAV